MYQFLRPALLILGDDVLSQTRDVPFYRVLHYRVIIYRAFLQCARLGVEITTLNY